MVTTLGPPFGSALLAELGLGLTPTHPSGARSQVMAMGRTSLTPEIGAGPQTLLYFTCKVLITICNYF